MIRKFGAFFRLLSGALSVLTMAVEAKGARDSKVCDDGAFQKGCERGTRDGAGMSREERERSRNLELDRELEIRLLNDVSPDRHEQLLILSGGAFPFRPN